MGGQVLCEVCGNEVEEKTSQCPYCRSRQTFEQVHKQVPLHRVVNLESGMPTVEMALTRLRNEISTAPGHGYRLLRLIHGYGSSGRGGAIRREVRRQLRFMLEKKEINDFIAGEECSSRSGHWRQTVRRFPFLGTYGKPNPGITFVIL